MISLLSTVVDLTAHPSGGDARRDAADEALAHSRSLTYGTLADKARPLLEHQIRSSSCAFANDRHIVAVKMRRDALKVKAHREKIVTHALRGLRTLLHGQKFSSKDAGLKCILFCLLNTA